MNNIKKIILFSFIGSLLAIQTHSINAMEQTENNLTPVNKTVNIYEKGGYIDIPIKNENIRPYEGEILVSVLATAINDYLNKSQSTPNYRCEPILHCLPLMENGKKQGLNLKIKCVETANKTNNSDGKNDFASYVNELSSNIPRIVKELSTTEINQEVYQKVYKDILERFKKKLSTKIEMYESDKKIIENNNIPSFFPLFPTISTLFDLNNLFFDYEDDDVDKETQKKEKEEKIKKINEKIEELRKKQQEIDKLLNGSPKEITNNVQQIISSNTIFIKDIKSGGNFENYSNASYAFFVDKSKENASLNM